MPAAALATLLLLSLIVFAILRMEAGAVAEKMTSAAIFYILPALIFLEFGLLINDLLAMQARKPGIAARLGFSEVRLAYDLDVTNTPIPLKTKLRSYPVFLVFFSVMFVVVLLVR